MTESSRAASVMLANAESGRDVAFLDEFQNIVQDITARTVNDALRARMQPSRLITVAAGSIDSRGNPVAKMK